MTVTDILFLDPTQAIVWFDVVVQDGPALSPEGRALLIDGRWVAARETIGSLLAAAGIHIHAPG